MKTPFLQRFKHFCLLMACLTGFLSSAEAQVYTVSMVVTPTNKTCYSGSLTASYVATVTPPVRGYVYGTDYTFNLSQTTFKLRTAASGAGGAVLLTNTGGTAAASAISGSFDLSAVSLAPDVYTIYASVTVVTSGGSQVVQTTTTFIIGYQTAWTDLLDMQALPSTYSAKRTFATSGVTYARAISANTIAAGSTPDGWIATGAQFSGTTGSVFVALGKTTTALSDPTLPTGTASYVEFRKTGASTGAIYVRSAGTTYTLSGVTFTDRILIRRSSGTLKFYKEGTTTTITGAPTITFSGALNVGAFAANTGDGVSDVLTSFSCVFENQFFYLKDEVEQSIAYVSASDSKLRFKYEEAYFDAAGTLNYAIRCLNDDVTPSLVTVTKPKNTNWIEIPLGAGGVAFTSGNVYLLEVTDAKGRKQYLKYKKI